MADAQSLHLEMLNVVKHRDFTHLRDLYHPDYTYESADGTRGGADAGVAVAEGYTSAFPDLDFEIRHEYRCGESVSVVEFTARGTHQGDLEGIAPTGHRVKIDVCNVIEVLGGKILREREYFDELSMMRQLGLAD